MSEFNVNEIVQSTGLPDNMDYQLKKAGVGAQSKRILYPSTQTTYVGNSSTTISIPISTGTPGQYLDPSQSYLSFRITNYTTNNADPVVNQAVKLDGNCNCVFRRYELYSNNGSNQIKDCIGYNVLYNMMMDAQVNEDERKNYMGLMMGTTVNQLGQTLTAGANKLFNTNLLCGFMNGEKYIPLGAIKSGDLELRFSLEDAQTALKTSAGTHIPGYTITDVHFVAQIVELDSENEALVQMSSGGVFAWGSEEYLNHNTSLATANTQNILIPFNKGSLKGLYTCMRETADLTAVNKLSLGGRQKNTISQYQYQIGSSMVPPVPINCNDIALCCSELLRSFHSINHPSGGIINKTNFIVENEDDGGTFMIGTELENFSNKDDVLQSGTDTTSSNIYFKGQFTGGENCRYDFFGMYDVIYVIDQYGNVDIRS